MLTALWGFGTGESLLLTHEHERHSNGNCRRWPPKTNQIFLFASEYAGSLLIAVTIHIMPKSASGSHHAEARTGRKLVEIAQVARGRTPLKYEFEVIPFFAGKQLSEDSGQIQATAAADSTKQG
jgi:hypothetical protein